MYVKKSTKSAESLNFLDFVGAVEGRTSISYFIYFNDCLVFLVICLEALLGPDFGNALLVRLRVSIS